MRQRPVLDIFYVVMQDDQGRWIRPPYLLRGYALERLYPTRPPAPVVREVSKESNRGLVALPLLICTLLALVLFAGCGALASLVFPKNPIAMLVLSYALYLPIYTLIADVAVLTWVRAKYRPRYRAVCLRLRHCPHCMYPLADIPRDADGFTTCPECAATWRMDPTRPVRA